MYLIKKDENRILKLEQKSFSELGFKEREHLQEWLANNPEALGEELLIIQKEFDGFNDTNERLDLLALDKQGNLVIIENKLDDSGKDVTWQVLKYASYCSTLKKEQICIIYQKYLDKITSNESAIDNIVEFLNANDYAEISLNSGQTQRIVLVAGNYRKEVTSTVLWLLNYKLRIQCFKATPFQLGEQLLLNIEQIIPMQEAEDYVISMANKTQDDIDTQEELKTRYILRLDFWKELLKQLNLKTSSFNNISPSKDNWIGTGAGISGASLNFVISNRYARVELYMNRSSQEENKLIFDSLLEYKDEIETKFSNTLVWERLDLKKACRIKFEIIDVDYFVKQDQQKMIDFMIKSMLKLEPLFKEYIIKIKSKIKNKD